MFKRSKESDKWFRDIIQASPFTTLLDHWYVCCLVGMLKSNDKDPIEPIDITRKFSAEFGDSRRIIVGLLILTEIKKNNLDITNDDEIKELLIKIIEPNSDSNLTDYGFDRLNKYAYGGLQTLTKEYITNARPTSTESFLQFYSKKIEKWVSESPILN